MNCMKGMDDAPYDFIRNHRPADLKRFLHFKHRTFNSTDLLYFIRFLTITLSGRTDSLESAFLPDDLTELKSIGSMRHTNTGKQKTIEFRQTRR